MSSEVLVLLFALVTLVLLGVAVLLSRRARTARGATLATASEAPVRVAEPTESLILVPLPTRRGEALLLGCNERLDAFERSGLGRRSGVRSSGPLPQVIRQVMSVGGVHANNNADRDIDAGCIVALSDETMIQLSHHKPAYDKAGNTLGLVRGDKGRMKHVMRLDKAGAKAVTASNAATLAMTAAVGQQLEHIEEQLTEIRATLDGLVADLDRERLTQAVAANDELQTIADSIRRRGVMTDADRADLSSLRLPVAAGAVEAEFKFEEILDGGDRELDRRKRRDLMKDLLGQERLEYWLAVRVETELAVTRRDLLTLFWEHSRHPETASQLLEQTRHSITARQEALHEVAELLKGLADPESRTRLDPLRQISRHQLKRHQALVTQLLDKHGAAFATPDDDPFSISGLVDPSDVCLLGEANDEPPAEAARVSA